MNRHSCDAKPEELALLRSLRTLAAKSRPVQAGLPQGLVTGGNALPGYRLVTSWTEIFRTWQRRAPTVTDLITLKERAADLCARRVTFADDSGAETIAEMLVDITLLSADQEGFDSLGVEVWLSGYVDLVLEA